MTVILQGLFCQGYDECSYTRISLKPNKVFVLFFFENEVCCYFTLLR